MNDASKVINPAKVSLAAGEAVLCMSVRLARTPEIALIARAAGYDALYVDMLHGQMTVDDASRICIAANLAGLTSLVRVPGHDPVWMTRVLDGGAMGVIVPQVETAAEAAEVVRHCRFPPQGQRSVPGPGPLIGFRSMSLGAMNDLMNEVTMISVMLESPEAIAHVEEIASVEGVDILQVGTHDMTTAMGIPGQLDHPRLAEAVETMARACAAHGKVLGIGGIRDDQALAARFIRAGARFVTANNDGAFALQGGRRLAEMLRAAIAAGMAEAKD
jgi:2-keto-3-deoxy-L-rhamnonate aldolase RhmA